MKHRWFAFTTAVAAALAAQQGAHAQTAPAPANAPGSTASSGEVIITAQRKAENIQSVPIAVSAFTNQDLKNQRIDNGSNLVTAVPNMTFQPGLYGKPDFVIRGIGYQLVTSTGEAGVALHENDAPLTISRIAQEDFFDVGRIEVLRGPQGTLYGRNATGGVVNTITQKPLPVWAESATGEVGSFNSHKLQGYVNAPLGDMFALRVAGDYFRRDGFQTNAFNGEKVNDVNIWAGRATLSFKPNDKTSGFLMYEHFNEEDGGSGQGGNARGVCVRDPGPTSVGGVAVTDSAIQNYESNGCLQNGNIYSNAALTGVPNGVGVFGNRLLAAFGDLYSGLAEPNDRLGINFDQNPFDSSQNDLYQFQLQRKLTDALTLTSLLTHSEDHVASGQGGFESDKLPFSLSSPQILGGASLDRWTFGNFQDLRTAETTEEIRLQSAYDGPINFSVGGIYDHLYRRDDVFVYDNVNTLIGAGTLGFPLDLKPATAADGGHYYFQSLNPYRLVSLAAFGEFYWQFTHSLKLTAGYRITDDRKTFDNNSSAGNLLNALGDPITGLNEGYAYFSPEVAEYKEPTWRVNLDWHPDLGFTDDTLLYASVSRGYKGGGFNPPNIDTFPPYSPEFVNAYEIGAKNELFGKKLTLNLAGFYYDYKGYQFTEPAGFGTKTVNVDAHISGAELEGVLRPVSDMRLNAEVGYLHTAIQPGPNAMALNPYDPTGGDPTFAYMRTLLGGCVANAANLGKLISDIQTHTPDSGGYTPVASDLANLGPGLGGDLCNNTTTILLSERDPHGLVAAYDLFAGVPGGQGVGQLPVSIAGNRLPDVPDWTVAVGAQYTFRPTQDWTITPRVDVHYQGAMFTDLFNSADNAVKAYDVENAAVTISDASRQLDLQVFVKNIGDKNDIIGASVGGGPITGDGKTIIVEDPRTWGVSLTKRF